MSLIKNTAIYTIGNIIPQITGFILLPVYTYYVNPSEYGIVSSMETIGNILLVFFSFSLDRAAYRFYFDRDKHDIRGELLGTLFFAMLLIAFAEMLVVFILNPWMGQIFSSIPFNPYYIYAIVTPFLTVFSLIPITYFRVAEKPKTFLIVQVVNLALTAGFILFFIIIKQEKATGILKGTLLAKAVMVPFFLAYAIKYFKPKINFSLIREALIYCWPFIPTLLVAWVLNLSDRIFIDRFTNLEQLGIYSVAYKISMVFFVFSNGYKVAFTPTFFKLINHENQEKAIEKVRRIIDISTYLYVMITFLIGLFAYEAVYLFTGSQYHDAYLIVRILVFSHLFSAIDGISSSLYRLQSKRSVLNLMIALLAAGLNLLLNYLLIPPYGIAGAAIATVLSLLASFYMGYQISKKDFFIPLPVGKIALAISGSIGVLAAFNYFLEKYIILSIILKSAILLIMAVYIFQNRKKIISTFNLQTLAV